MQQECIIRAFSLSGYRSFGAEEQKIKSLSKINLFIGQNNSGKSNILSFVHEIYPTLSTHNQVQLKPLDNHIPTRTDFSVGISIPLEVDEKGENKYFNEKILPKFKQDIIRTPAPGYALRAFQKKSEIDNTEDAWFNFDSNLTLITSTWEEAFECLDDREISKLWQGITRSSGGGRTQHWYPESLRYLTPKFEPANTVLIPAIRKVGDQGSVSEDFSGKGIIERLVRLQNPDVHNQSDREKFNKINLFLRNVTGNTTATIEIPHERDTILVHMDNKTLPLESLGTGIHEVLILASAATILENTVICMEEPELHLNPILQKKLIRYLDSSTNNQYFITTHSAALMDTPNAEVYHVSMQDGESKIRRVTSDKHRSEVCGDLGYHPSDLLQSNCIIWVEGPSDRIYLNFWINAHSTGLIEGIHYSIMFYGGRLASHLTGEDSSEKVDDFISLRRLNRRSAILIDSDKNKARAHINKTKKRLKAEFDNGPGFAWITDGREIENYIDPELVKTAITKTKPSAKINSELGKFDNPLSIITRGGKASQASKMDVAKYITENSTPNLNIHDLKRQIKKLVDFIEASNPATHVTS